ncbi:hypothetical protein IWQ56_002618, partial [Coemansia nantahalensis]
RTNDTRDLEDMPISQWSANTPKKIARIKREHMDSEENFREEILEYFHPECRPKVTGRSVVDVLRNPLAAQQSLERQDPLDQRLMHEDAIVEALTRVMAKYDEPAKQVLRERQANAQAAASPASMQEATGTVETPSEPDASQTNNHIPVSAIFLLHTVAAITNFTDDYRGIALEELRVAGIIVVQMD